MASAPPSSDDALASVGVSSFETTVEGYVVYHIDYARVSGRLLSPAQRRYNDVAAFWDDLSAAHPELPELQTYRFPRKSIFNTHSHFTKERRRARASRSSSSSSSRSASSARCARSSAGEPAAAPRKSAAARRAPRPRAPVWDHAPRDRSEQQALGLVDIFVALTAALTRASASGSSASAPCRWRASSRSTARHRASSGPR